MPNLKLKRAREFANWLRAYHVVVDGERVAKIRSGREIEVEVAPGRHTVELTIDWCRSNQAEVEVRAGETVALSCGSNYTGKRLFRGFRGVLADHQSYLWLRLST